MSFKRMQLALKLGCQMTHKIYFNKFNVSWSQTKHKYTMDGSSNAKTLQT